MTAIHSRKLPNGKDIWVLQEKSKQQRMFRAFTGTPRTLIASINELNDSYGTGPRIFLEDRSICRAREFGFHPKGFETDLNKPIGKRIVWLEWEKDVGGKETGRLLVAIFNVPDAPVKLQNGIEISLQNAAGMGIIPIDKLEITANEVKRTLKGLDKTLILIVYEASVSERFKPETDVKVKDVLRTTGWSGSVDEDGIILNNGKIDEPLNWCTNSANSWGIGEKHFRVLSSKEFLFPYQLDVEYLFMLRDIGIKPEEIGWNGNLTLRLFDYNGFFRHHLSATDKWSDPSWVAVVNQNTVIEF